MHIAPGTLRITVLLHPVHADLSPLKESRSTLARSPVLSSSLGPQACFVTACITHCMANTPRLSNYATRSPGALARNFPNPVSLTFQ